MRVGYYFLSGRLMNLGISRNEILEYARKLKPDVIIANSIADFPIIRYLRANGLEFKSVYIDHVNLSMDTFSSILSKNSLPLTFGSGIAACNTDSYKRKLLGFFDMCVALNIEQKKQMEKFTKKSVYIPNGIAKHKCDGKLSKRFIERYSLEGKFKVFYIGRMFERQKNVSTLIKAFKMLKGEDLRLLIIGEGPSLKDYIELSRNDNRIVFTGALDDNMLNAAYCSSELYVLPSLWEGFSITMLEAASHSVPMLLSSKAYPKDFEKLKIRIESFDPSDADALTKKIKEMHSSKSLYSNAKQASQKIAMEFSEKKMIERYKKLILSLI
jgi:glycosyltransferase involved in cell wall biosynthesis